MDKRIRIIAVIMTVAFALSFASCSLFDVMDKGPQTSEGPVASETTADSGPRDITSHWEFAKIKKDDWTQTRKEWEALNATGLGDPVPIPTFECADGKVCVLNMSGTEHKGNVTLKDDGSYEFAFDSGTVWGTATISGRNLHIVLGEDIAELDFEAR